MRAETLERSPRRRRRTTRIFIERVVETDSNGDGFIDAKDDLDQDGTVDTATRYLFNEETFDKYCVVPDADSFDDLESVDPNTGRIEIPRGITPVVRYCEADGIETGPMHDELYPSKWCKKHGCPEKPEK